MRIWLLLLIGISIGSCKQQESVVSSEINKQNAVAKRYMLNIQFSSEEDLKRVPYRFQNLKMELIKPISASDRIYAVSILCKDYEIDGIIEKLNLQEGIVWAKRTLD